MEAMNNNHSLEFKILKQDKDTIKNQKSKVFLYLKLQTATATMVTEATGVPQKNVTRFKREFEKQGLLRELYKGLCKITKYRASYLSTNQKLFLLSNCKNLGNV